MSDEVANPMRTTIRSPLRPLPSERSELLREAEQLTCGDRNNQYGPPTQDFDRTAEILTSLGYGRYNPQADCYDDLVGSDVAIIMMALKLSRLSWSRAKRDSWVDTAGYAACGWECVEHESTNKMEGAIGNATQQQD